ncbi:flagellar basal body rod protein FlgB [Shewanella sp. Choline-02u-19]|jgi:flagellar basal-body rod protein FlgB|uniref:flagellar basal body rod protein FlgB n=1 Tax=Shewanella TaxID=22 RepID=UPI000C331AC0|nr:MULTISPECIES: flagellar basal body rod protein FlgB [Shewanella]MCL1057815.1 flagellar basal body rod protein FlgB [Shewanella gelidimarina]PKG56534.1 flagellar basal body rod protein FlgB [Shewanella sp. GutDb-MelDb]PKG75932.1 flagellar basal body rod protein FlgB [Shewanella sp. GutCb]PKH55735.1 flagellar basal body rod protein FlgB [Shewanella sp. Bg11-22]PKI26851.1 flagellar basal body rod protein FlgB [Shewanella sp. Choline-02u-19]
MAINFDSALGVHQYTLGVRSQRAEVLSSNIANADTPNYKARDVDFAKAMNSAQSRQSGLSMTKSDSKHFDLAALTQQNVAYRVPNQPDTGDGNTVDIQEEQSAFMKNALEYQMSLGFLDSKFSGMKKAIRGE